MAVVASPVSLGTASAHDNLDARRQLGLWDTVSVIVGIVIGAGIFETAPLVFMNAGSPSAAMMAWTLGGILSLVGACCYAELATAYPQSGGDYVYLTRAYGSFVGFLFGWTQLTVLMTGSIGMMAYVFADYAVAGFRLRPALAPLLATLCVVTLTSLHLVSVVIGKRAQNLLSGMKLLALVLVVLIGFAGQKGPGAVGGMRAEGSFSLAMVLVLYTFGGWNDAAFVASEVRERHKNLSLALILGIALVTLVYVLVNLAFLFGLGFDKASSSQAIASDLLSSSLGQYGSLAMSVLVMLSAMSAASGLIFTGARVHAAVGRDHRALAALARWHVGAGAPVRALIAQLILTLLLIGAVGTQAGRTSIDFLLASLGAPAVRWSGHGGFDTLLRCTAPLFWLFFALSALATIVLRVRDPERPRPFSVPLYPALPIVFVAMCLFMAYSAAAYAGALSFVGVVLVTLGIPVYLVTSGNKRTPDVERSSPSVALKEKEVPHEAT